MLLNHFAIVGIKRSSNSSVQFCPKLLINQYLVQAVEIGSSFKYLSRFFTFGMENCEQKSILLDTSSDFLHKIDMIPYHPKNKLLLYHHYILSKLSWHLTIADLNKAWVIEHLDSVLTRHIRKWFESPLRSSISGLIVSRSYYDFNLVLPFTKFIQCQTIIRNLLVTLILGIYGRVQILPLTFNMINIGTPNMSSYPFKRNIIIESQN